MIAYLLTLEALEEIDECLSSELLMDTIKELEIANEETAISELRHKNLPFPALKTLKLSYNIEELADTALSKLKQLKELSLAKNLIRQFPQDALENTELDLLDLSQNKITILNTLLHLENLIVLNLSSNKIALIQSTAFNNLLNLTDLDLSNNNIVVLDEVVFAALEKLEVVNLGMNRLTTLPSGMFDKNLLLRNLVLSDNSFRGGMSDTFLSLNKRLVYLDLKHTVLKVNRIFIQNLTSLKYLNLDQTTMSDISYDLFAKMQNIERIHLSECHMWKIALIFRNNVMLNYLDISANGLERLPNQLFVNNFNLAFLNLSDNRLRELPFNLLQSTVLKTIDLSYNNFRGMEWYRLDIPTLENVHLRGNDISDLKTNFAGSLNLKYLDLRDNSLFFIEDDFFKKVSRLTWFEFMGNPFNCKCLDEIMLTMGKKNIGCSKSNYADGLKPICVVHDNECVKNVSFYKSSYDYFTKNLGI